MRIAIDLIKTWQTPPGLFFHATLVAIRSRILKESDEAVVISPFEKLLYSSRFCGAAWSASSPIRGRLFHRNGTSSVSSRDMFGNAGRSP